MAVTTVLTFGCIDESVVPGPFLALEIRAERTIRTALAARGCRVEFVDIAGHPLPDVADLLEAVSGLVLLGGADVDPALYGLPADHPNVHGVDRIADEFEIAALLRARELGIPVLCICRGAQVLNVAHGGTLIPDIEAWAIHHGPTRETIFVSEEIFLTADSRLADVVGRRRLVVQNGHHQAVAAVGAGLLVAARAADGIVEAIESAPEEPSWALGVQWHPEHPRADPDVFAALLDAFVAQVRADSGARSVGRGF